MNMMKSCIVSWYGNFLGTMIVASCMAWQSGVVPTAYSSSSTSLLGSKSESVFATVEDMRIGMGPVMVNATTGESVGGWCDNTANGAACFLIKSTAMRLNMEWDVAVTRGIGCNFLVCTALWLAQMSQEQVSKIFSIWICIVMFISSQFEAGAYTRPLLSST